MSDRISFIFSYLIDPHEIHMFPNVRILFKYGCFHSVVYIYGFSNVFATHGWIWLSVTHIMHWLKSWLLYDSMVNQLSFLFTGIETLSVLIERKKNPTLQWVWWDPLIIHCTVFSLYETPVHDLSELTGLGDLCHLMADHAMAQLFISNKQLNRLTYCNANITYPTSWLYCIQYE